MAIQNPRITGSLKLKGRPREQAKAQIMVMKAERSERRENRRRLFFTILDLIVIISFALAIYSVYNMEYLKGLMFVIIGSLPLAYFIIRRVLKKQKSFKE